MFKFTRGLCSLAGIAVLAASASAQLQFTEIMFNTIASPEGQWEWAEVHNPTGAAIDLDGYYFDDDDGNSLTGANIVNVNSGGSATVTSIPAGGTAVLYNGGNNGYDNSRFEMAWGIAPGSVPLIGVTAPPGLANGGDAIGVWAGTQYANDIGDGDMDGDTEVLSFSSAAASVDFAAGVGFPVPAVPNGSSIYWNGTGSYQDNSSSQWLISMAGTDGAVTSVQTVLNSAQINDTSDFGSPGVSTASTFGLDAGGTVWQTGSALEISEIMYNPASGENDWEWVEVVNTTAAAIDFAATPWTLSDTDGTQLIAENLTSGSVPAGGVAVLYNADALTLQNAQDAWGAGVNLIPATEFPQFGNGGDDVGLWDSFGNYIADDDAGTFGLANSHVPYTDDPPFPQDDGASSIYFDGTEWVISSADPNGFNPNAVFSDGILDHPGGDMGSPGFFGSMPPVINGDFDNDGDYDCADVDALVADIAGGSNTASFDLDGNGTVDTDDLSAWLLEAGEANIGPGRAYIDGDANLDGVVDVSDFNIWNGNKFSSTPAWCGGDFNADGFVDVSDFNIWNGNKFTSSDVSSVPEPGSLLMLLAGLPLVLRRWRR